MITQLPHDMIDVHVAALPAPAREANSQATAIRTMRPSGKQPSSADCCVLSVRQAPHDVADTSAINVSAPAQVVLPAGALLKWYPSCKQTDGAVYSMHILETAATCRTVGSCAHDRVTSVRAPCNMHAVRHQPAMWPLPVCA